MAGIDANALSVLHFDTDYTDSAPSSPPVWTAHGGAVISPVTPKFDAGCGLFVSATSSYIDTPDDALWTPGANKFTIDFWILFVTFTANGTPVGHATSSTEKMVITINAADAFATIKSSTVTANEIDIGSDGLSLNTAQWYHIAWIRGWGGNANDWAFCIDGTAIGTLTDSSTYPDFTGTFQLGRDPIAGRYANCKIDEFRFSNIARWTSNFTPPTSAYSSGSVITPAASRSVASMMGVG